MDIQISNSALDMLLYVTRKWQRFIAF